MSGLHFQELYLELSYLCNAACSHCYVSSSPFADRTKLDVEAICRVIEEAQQIDSINPKVAIAGGEPTLFWDSLLTVISFAAKRNFRVLLISNGWWGKSLTTCRQKLDSLIEHGLSRLELSTSNYHQQYVDSEALNNIILSSRDQPIELALHVRYSNSCGQAASLSKLKNLEGIELISAPITLVGRAEKEISKEEFRFAEDFPRGNCQDDLSLLINPKGDCFPCCGGAELTDSLRLGNIHDESLAEIIERAQTRKLLLHLTQKGPAILAEGLQDEGFQELNPSSCVNICDLCTSIFKSPSLSLAAERWVNSPSSRQILNSAANSGVRKIPMSEISRKKSSSKEVSVSLRAVADDIKKPLTFTEIAEILPSIANGTFQPHTVNVAISVAASGATLLATDDYYVKWAKGEHGIKLHEQIRLLEYMRSCGVKCVPEILAKYGGDNNFTSYIMPRYFTNSFSSTEDALGTAKKIINALEEIWRIPPNFNLPVDWHNYHRRMGLLLEKYDHTLSADFIGLGEKVLGLNDARTDTCTVHGDPTFENVVYDTNGNLILLDPNQQVAPAVCIPELDAAKILQSLFGWEAFIYRQTNRLQINTDLIPFIEQRFGSNGWITCIWLLSTHLIRTLPYGAKVGDANRLLPSLKDLIDYLSDLINDNQL